MSLRIGVIGCGGIARSHLQGYLAVGAEPVAAMDANPSAVETLIAQHPEMKGFDSVQALLDWGVDAVSICTPPSSHESIAREALQRGVHVLCEKPIAHTLESAQRLHDAAQQSSALCMIAFRHRFLPVMQKIKSLLDDGTLGEPVLFRNVFCGPSFEMKDKWFSQREISGGGSMLDTASHGVDLFRFFFGEVCDRRVLTGQHMNEIDVEDTGAVTLQSASGVLGSCMSSWVSGSYKGDVEVFGQKGRVLFDYAKPDKLTMRIGEEPTQELEVKSSDGFPEEIAHFVGAITGDHPLTCGAADGLRCLEILLQAAPVEMGS